MRSLKIQMGLKCNYRCSYCNQTARPAGSHGSPALVDEFLRLLPKWFAPTNADGKGVTIEFWGGEPFIYWKTMRPLAEQLRARYPDALFNVVTNGSVLTAEMIDWLENMAFSVAISHDGPAQRVNRGCDPFDDAKTAEAIRALHRRLSPKGLLNFNCVLARNNLSLAAVRRYLAEQVRCAVADIRLTTEEFLLPYEHNGYALSLRDRSDRRALFDALYRDIVSDGAIQVLNVREKLHDLFRSISLGRPASALSQRCAMDRSDSLAVDLKGNVLTCQNTAADAQNRIGHVADFQGIRLSNAWHWSLREPCTDCLVLQMCRGSCMRLNGDLWQKACENSYAFNLPILVAGLEHLTGGKIDIDTLIAQTPSSKCGRASLRRLDCGEAA